jgi:hypothetical protein
MAILIVTFVTFVCDGLIIVVSSMVLFVIVTFLHSNPTKREEKVNLIISAHTFVLLTAFAITQQSFCVRTVLGDLLLYDSPSVMCTFAGYFILVVIGNLYHVFINQVTRRAQIDTAHVLALVCL